MKYLIPYGAVSDQLVLEVELDVSQTKIAGISWKTASKSVRLLIKPKAYPALVQQLKIFLDSGKGEPADFPLLEEKSPPFFAKVYRELRRIPKGSFVTYAQLAKKAGSPKAMRAVGQAMARNRFPLVIPCHRVLPSDGKLGNYSASQMPSDDFGPRIKAALLKLEGVQL